MKKLILFIFMIYAASTYGSVISDIQRASSKVGVNPTTMCKIARIESNMNPKAKNKNSSARGLFQIIRSTEASLRRKHNVKGSIYNSYTNSLLAAHNLDFNSKYLKSHSKPATEINLYLTHLFGPLRALKFLNTNGKVMLKNGFKREYRANKSLFRNKSVDDLKGYFINKLKHVKGCI